jgi:hypothetical protein
MLALGGCWGGDDAPESTPTPGPSERFQTPNSLNSYRWSVDITASADLLPTDEASGDLGFEDAVLTLRIDGARLNPDREWTRAVSAFGYLSLERETIVIGERLWSRQASGAWRERAALNSPEDLIGQDVALSPAVLMGEDNPEYLEQITADLEAQPHTFETVNGRETRHWHLTTGFLAEAFQAMGERIPLNLDPALLSVDVWTDIETGVAIRIALTGASERDPQALRFEINLFDLNDPNIIVEEPPGAIGR